MANKQLLETDFLLFCTLYALCFNIGTGSAAGTETCLVAQ